MEPLEDYWRSNNQLGSAYDRGESRKRSRVIRNVDRADHLEEVVEIGSLIARDVASLAAPAHLLMQVCIID